LGLLLAAIPVAWVYLVAQRRAAVVALVIGLALFGIMLFWRQRSSFWKVMPALTIIAIAYTGAFWNSQSMAGFPAQAIKTVIAPEQASVEDQNSDLYRVLETFNLSATVRSAPALGIGFGQPFLRPYPLPDISAFEFNAYIPHNSFIWIWTKMGFGGFVTLLYLVGRTMIQGAARARFAASGPDAVAALSAVTFVAMYMVYLYVDIGWEPRNVFLLALAMGMCTGPISGYRESASAARTTAKTDDASASSLSTAGSQGADLR
jgi:O-antigen ligase